MKSVFTIVFWGLSAVALSGQEIKLADGQVLFTYGWKDQRVRTSDVEIVLSFEGDGAQPRYRIELSDLQGEVRSESFEQSPGEPKISAFNTTCRCNEQIIFLTLRYPPPKYADVRAYFFETHAFHAETLGYLDTAPVAYEDIALLEVGVDPGWPQNAPQPYQVVCGTGPEGFKLDIVHEAETP